MGNVLTRKTMRVLSRSQIAVINRQTLASGFDHPMRFAAVDSLRPYQKYPIVDHRMVHSKKGRPCEAYVRTLVKVGAGLTDVVVFDMDLKAFMSLKSQRVEFV